LAEADISEHRTDVGFTPESGQGAASQQDSWFAMALGRKPTKRQGYASLPPPPEIWYSGRSANPPMTRTRY